MQKYPLDISVAVGRARVRQQFEAYARFFNSLPNSDKSNKLAAMNAALLKGTQELIEVHNRWSQKTHVMRWFEGAFEHDSPALASQRTAKQIKMINESVLEDKTSPFLIDFLTRTK